MGTILTVFVLWMLLHTIYTDGAEFSPADRSSLSYKDMNSHNISEIPRTKKQSKARDLAGTYYTLDSVNFRSRATAESDALTVLPRGTAVNVTEYYTGGWSRVTHNDKQGYIRTEYLGTKQLALAGRYYALDNVNLRSGATTESNVVQMIQLGDQVEVTEFNEDGWSRVTAGGDNGFIRTDFLSVTKPEPIIAANNLASQVIAFGMQYLGTPYVWGGTNLSRGVDCSGFVYSVFRNFGIYLNRSSAGMSSNGTKVNKSDLRMGDLVLFGSPSSGRISHVGIYIGDGQFIHSGGSGRGAGVMISSLYSSYNQSTYVTARRVI